MNRPVTFLAALLLLAAAIGLHARRAAPAVPAPTHLIGAAPPLMLWAWEEPEDLRALNPSTAGVAVLASRVFLGQSAYAIPRRQPLSLPPNAYAEAVVRLEATRAFADTPQLRAETAAAILRTAQLPGIRGLQLDFDATASQQAFYADILHRVRAQLPPGLSLTVTALVSWCASPTSWLHRLPPGEIDAAIPMYFRLGQHAGRWPVREPLCAASLGASTDEPATAPPVAATQRLYLFNPHPWKTSEIALAQGAR
jgi:hypothetical protein